MYLILRMNTINTYHIEKLHIRHAILCLFFSDITKPIYANVSSGPNRSVGIFTVVHCTRPLSHLVPNPFTPCLRLCHTLYQTLPHLAPDFVTPCTRLCHILYQTLQNFVSDFVTPCTRLCHTLYHTL